METKNNKVKMETIRHKLRFDFGFYVEPEGLTGGIALCWNDVSIDVEIAHKNLVHIAISTTVDLSRWAATFVYGCPTHAGKEKVWNELKEIASSERLPWLCVGDFNQVLTVGDKFGGNLPDLGRIRAFNDMLNDCRLVDLGCIGPRFTWRNNRAEGGFIMERIDMAFANMEWRERFDTALVFVEIAVGFDHNPLLINTNFSLNKVRRPFRFESLWTTEEECHHIIVKAWDQVGAGSKMFRLCKKLRGCKDDLKVRQRNNFEDLRFQIATLWDQLAGIQKENENRFNADNYVKEKVMITKLEDLWQKEAMFWHQRSRVNWLRMGDKNARFFHLSTIHRRQKNQVAKLKDENGIWQVDKECIVGVIKGHFEKLYSPPHTRDIAAIISLVDPVVPSNMNIAFTKPVTREEVKAATFKMGALKAPGSDGFPRLFYQTYWHVVGEDVFNSAKNFFEGRYLLKKMNPHEVFHFLKHKKSGMKRSVAVKLHLSQAYDKICWDSLIKVMEKMGFSLIWIGWIK
ncbi:hypothetical protein RHSIM_Rhsim09G0083100 [Rhododendron simsii]|uniref:Reverse transcriptase n=1 Tax=Rhododendron simsii TaxID=118357 RepID=A0A834GC78_RHOSS|nr:hypothetical protein RHSIM_Rhsim09G0083100 [Rhododendron simsii]